MDLVNLRVARRVRRARASRRPSRSATLQDLQREGKLDLIGVSNVTLEGLQSAAELVDLGEVQNAYSVMDRTNEPLVDFCREREIAFVPFFPLGSAFTGGPAKLAADPAVAEVAAKHGATPSQVALAWLLARYDRMLLIPGTTSVAHLEENMAAGDVALDAEDLARLESVRAAWAARSTERSDSSERSREPLEPIVICPAQEHHLVHSSGASEIHTSFMEEGDTWLSITISQSSSRSSWRLPS